MFSHRILSVVRWGHRCCAVDCVGEEKLYPLVLLVAGESSFASCLLFGLRRIGPTMQLLLLTLSRPYDGHNLFFPTGSASSRAVRLFLDLPNTILFVNPMGVQVLRSYGALVYPGEDGVVWTLLLDEWVIRQARDDRREE